MLGIQVQLGILTKPLQSNPEDVRRTLAPLRRLVEKSVLAVDQFSAELRSSMLNDLGLISALRSYIAEFPKRKGERFK